MCFAVRGIVRRERASDARLGLEDGVGEFVVRRKETDARSAGQPVLSIARTIRSSARAGSVSGSVVVEWAQCTHGPG